MSSPAFFVTGTDTGVGKTFVTAALLRAARRRGLESAALKPVAAGTTVVKGVNCNEDALILQQACSVALPLAELNPVCLAQPIAPHIAARQAGRELSVATLLPACRQVLDRQADLTLVEGAGGWLVPLNERETLADLVVVLQLPVILVVGMRLGCLNHALLSAAVIRGSGLVLGGWVANHIDPDMPVARENVSTLENMLDAPLLGVFPYQANDECQHEVADEVLSGLLF